MILIVYLAISDFAVEKVSDSEAWAILVTKECRRTLRFHVAQHHYCGWEIASLILYSMSMWQIMQSHKDVCIESLTISKSDWHSHCVKWYARSLCHARGKQTQCLQRVSWTRKLMIWIITSGNAVIRNRTPSILETTKLRQKNLPNDCQSGVSSDIHPIAGNVLTIHRNLEHLWFFQG